MLIPLAHRPTVTLLALTLAASAWFSPGDARSETALDRAKRELSAIQASENPASEERASIERAWADTVQAIQDAQRWKEREAEFQALTADAPRVLAETRAALSATNGVQDPGSGTDALATLESQLAQAQARKASAEQLIQELQQERRRRADRSLALPGELSRLRQQLETPAADQEGLAPSGVSASLSEASRALAAARTSQLTAELAAREAESASYEARSGLLTARQDLAVRRAYESSRAADALAERVSRARNEAADAATLEAEALRRRLEASPPVVRELALENEALAAERRDSVTKTGLLTVAAAEMAAEADQVASRQADVTRRVDAAQFTKVVALLMRRHRSELPDLGRSRAQLRARQRATTELVVRQLDVESARADLTDLDAAVVRASSRLDGLPLSPEQRAEAESSVRDLLVRQRSLLDELDTELGRTLGQLGELDRQQQRLIEVSASYGAFIDEHLLWLRESSVFGPRQAKELGSAAAWLATPSRWGECLSTLSAHVRGRPLDLIPLLLLVLAPLVRRHLLQRVDAIGAELARTRRHRFRSTLNALTATVGATIAWSLVLYWLALTIGAATADTELGPFLAAGLERLARLLVPFLLLIDTCRPLGLAHAHFRWPAAQLETVRGSSWLLGGVTVPALTLAWAFESAERADLRDSLSRLALLVGLTAFAVFHHRALKPQVQAGQRPGRRDWIAHRLSVVLPLVLVVAGVLGYSFAARELGARLIQTDALFFCVAILHAVALRWLVVERRRLRLEEARKSSSVEATALEEVAESTAPGDTDEIDLDVVDAQTRHLMRAAAIVTLCASAWWLWSGFLPATRAADEVVLWTTGSAATETAAPAVNLVPIATADEAPATATPGHRVTLFDVLLAIAVFVLTLLAAGNVPGLLDIALLRRLDLQPGSGYAIITLTRYFLTIGGLVMAAGLLGITWNSVQWLAAAVTVGLGFGLQEIFANFVSGLIILFERPMRVGDIVTVGGIEGVVTRIRTRATTISDWDRRELLVPNREFITSQLINWTLTDPITRVVIPVGIAYGSDTRRAAELLLASAKENQNVLKEPAPSVVFRAFGESSLDFQLRLFIPRRDVWPQVMHQVHLAIDDAFRAAGIEIAFPQRDIHVRTYPDALSKPD